MQWPPMSLLLGALIALLGTLPLPAQNFMEMKPSPQQVAWQDLEFGDRVGES